MNRMMVTALIALLMAAMYPQSANAQSPEAPRVRKGLLALYDFASPSGAKVEDRSNAGEPITLIVSNPNAVRRAAGTLEIRGKTTIRSQRPARRLIAAVKRSGAISVDAWLRPANMRQSGPARILTISRNPNERNFTLGQDGDKLDVRLRTRRTSKNGIPSVSSPPAR